MTHSFTYIMPQCPELLTFLAIGGLYMSFACLFFMLVEWLDKRGW